MVTKPTGRPRGRPPKSKASFFDLCRHRYGVASKGKSQLAKRSLDVFKATGDPLSMSDAAFARRLYGLENAPRPTRALAALHARTWGDEASIIADYARAYQRTTGKKLRHAIADAIATCAERGTFIGDNGAPASFATALRAVYEAAAENQFEPCLGDTGRRLHVRPAINGAIVLDPETMRAIAQEGEVVPDTRFWRRRILNGDVIEITG